MPPANRRLKAPDVRLLQPAEHSHSKQRKFLWTIPMLVSDAYNTRTVRVTVAQWVEPKAFQLVALSAAQRAFQLVGQRAV